MHQTGLDPSRDALMIVMCEYEVESGALVQTRTGNFSFGGKNDIRFTTSA
jgi:hypothetical protein